MGSFSLTKAVYLDQENLGGLLSISNISICTKALLTWENGFSENRKKHKWHGKMVSLKTDRSLNNMGKWVLWKQTKLLLTWEMGSLKTDKSIANMGKWVLWKQKKALLTWENGFSENRTKYYLYGKMCSVRQIKTLLAWENGSSENRKKYYYHGKMGSLKTDQSIMNARKWVRWKQSKELLCFILSKSNQSACNKIHPITTCYGKLLWLIKNFYW